MEMASQEAYYRQRFLKYVKEHEVAAAVERYYLSRKTVRKWKKRYNGTLASLESRPRTPRHFPRQQTKAEFKLVQRDARMDMSGYEQACGHGFKRSCGRFERTARKLTEPGKSERTSLTSAVNILDRRCR